MDIKTYMLGILTALAITMGTSKAMELSRFNFDDPRDIKKFGHNAQYIQDLGTALALFASTRTPLPPALAKDLESVYASIMKLRAGGAGSGLTGVLLGDVWNLTTKLKAAMPWSLSPVSEAMKERLAEKDQKLREEHALRETQMKLEGEEKTRVQDLTIALNEARSKLKNHPWYIAKKLLRDSQQEIQEHEQRIDIIKSAIESAIERAKTPLEKETPVEREQRDQSITKYQKLQTTTEAELETARERVASTKKLLEEMEEMDPDIVAEGRELNKNALSFAEELKSLKLATRRKT